jgi:hypothetical protein
MARPAALRLRSVTTKGGSLPPQPARSALSFGQAAGLTLYVATLAILTALFITFLTKGGFDLHRASLLFSTLCAMVATFGMGWDAYDLWVRGRQMTPHSVRLFRSMVFVAVIGALATGFLASSTLPVLVLGPSMLVYLFIARRPAAASSRGAGSSRPPASGGGRTGSVSSSKARQRRGGKKHK